MNRKSYSSNQAANEMQRNSEQRYVFLINKQKNQQDLSNTSKSANSKVHSIKSPSIILARDKNNKFWDSSISTTSSIQQPIVQRTFMAHPFFNVWNGMSYEEWTKSRDAFVASYFKEE